MHFKKMGLMGLMVATLAVGPTACTTTSTGQKIPDPIVLQSVAQEAAAVGATFWLQNHNADRTSFELARTSLKALIATGSGSPADLQAALSQLPVKQLQGSQGAVIVQGAVVLLNAAGTQLAKLDKQEVWANYVQPVARGLLAGLDQAMGPP